MEMWEITKKLESGGKKKKKAKGATPGLSADHTYKPCVNTVVPDFEKAKQDWDRTLQVISQQDMAAVLASVPGRIHVFVCWLVGLLACWLAGLLACLFGTAECWLVGLLAC